MSAAFTERCGRLNKCPDPNPWDPWTCFVMEELCGEN